MTMTAVIVIMIMTAVIVMTTGALHVVIILTMTAVMTTVMTAVHEAQYVTYEPCTGVLIINPAAYTAGKGERFSLGWTKIYAGYHNLTI